MTTTHTASGPIGSATLTEFIAGLRGTALLPGDADYDQARSIWNGAHDRRPALVVRCAGVADVIRTVDLARSEGLPLAVRGGGHSIPGFSTVDDGIVLDLSLMTGIEVHPDDRSVTAQAGCTWKDLDAETQQFGLAVTGGLVSSTGIAGFTTGGGIGWLMRKHGLACDNLVGADVVTADGQFVHASASENAELFWGLRGGGGNFGVVTSFEYQLHEVGPTVLSGLVFYPAEEAEQVLAGYRAACAAAPDELTTLVNLTTAPPVPFLPEVGARHADHRRRRLLVRRPRRRRGGHRTVPFPGHGDRRRVRGQPLRGMAAGPRPALPARDPQLLPLGVPARGRRPGAARAAGVVRDAAQPAGRDPPAAPRRRRGHGSPRRRPPTRSATRSSSSTSSPGPPTPTASPSPSNGRAG